MSVQKRANTRYVSYFLERQFHAQVISSSRAIDISYISLVINLYLYHVERNTVYKQGTRAPGRSCDTWAGHTPKRTQQRLSLQLLCCLVQQYLSTVISRL